MPELQKQPPTINSLHSLPTGLHRIESEYVDTEKCYRLTGSALDNEVKVTLWIAKSDFTLKQISETVSLPVEDETSSSQKSSFKNPLNTSNNVLNEQWSTVISYQAADFDAAVNSQRFEEEF